jgi:hypothetical protein
MSVASAAAFVVLIISDVLESAADFSVKPRPAPASAHSPFIRLNRILYSAATFGVHGLSAA